MPFVPPSWLKWALGAFAMLALLVTVQLQRSTIKSLRAELNNADLAAEILRTRIADRDRLIATQSAGIDALKAAAAVNEAAYRERLKTVEQIAKTREARAAALMGTTTAAEDELGQCRAARDLLKKELTDDDEA